ncbi:ABC transporter substrate-binding protein [Tessaracoccus sp. OS52]|uniref:ABC transporter substrate-binding protein n=1 Tax=Tessaracoccus sp. OS52 TaxID=2886691 RepID=UPI001D101924|nr:ABC transporter substrate-binding protein [Tessaracoccus sp. OS52]MCC2592235.1 ABC transporter substrate-binding protein [Tessaracoccus sp. OS52]
MNPRRSLLALGAVAALALAACSQPGSSENPTQDAAPLEIGIVQYVSHDALDAVQEGFIDELAANGYSDGETINLDIQNPQADQATLTAIANQFAQAEKDLVLAIATPAGQAVAQVIPEKPVVFAAVTDPVAAELVASLEAPGANVTGVSDLNPVDEQLGLLLEIAPDVKNVGIVYSSGEINAEVQVAAAEEAAGELGLTIQKAAVSNSSEVQQAAESLDVDAFYVPTDNNVVAAIESLIQVAEARKIPVIASDNGAVERGAIASQTVNYEQQGRDAAMMAIEILEGANPGEMPVQMQEQFDLSINEAAAERMGVTIPESVLERAVTTY